MTPRTTARFWWACALFGVAACVAKPDFAGLVAGPRGATFQERITSAKLDNGLRVALLPDGRTNLVGVEVRYEVGGADDPPDAAGLAHYAEHLLFDAGIAAGGRDVTLEANAVTSSDRTRFFATALDHDLDRLLDIAARRLEANCTDLPPDTLARERDVVVEEAKQRGQFAWDGQGVASAIWGAAHPYARAVGGVAFARATPATVCDFIAQHYGTASATLVVTGHFDDGELQHIRERFGRIAARPQATRWAGAPGASGDTRVVVPGLHKPTAMMVFPVPAEAAAPTLQWRSSTGRAGCSTRAPGPARSGRSCSRWGRSAPVSWSSRRRPTPPMTCRRSRRQCVTHSPSRGWRGSPRFNRPRGSRSSRASTTSSVQAIASPIWSPTASG